MREGMKKGKELLRDQKGSSLIEIVISMALLLIVVASVGAGIKFAVAANARSSTLMQEQQAVANAVERLMATGIDLNEENEPVLINGFEVVHPEDEIKITATVTSVEDGDPMYTPVTVAYWAPKDGGSKEIAFSVDTTVRLNPYVAPPADPEEGGG